MAIDPTSLISSYGLWLIAGMIALECIGIPVPGETILVAAAIYAGTTHHLSIGAVIGAAIAGAIVGNVIAFSLGRAYGYRLLRRYGRYIHLDETQNQDRPVSVPAARRQGCLLCPFRSGAAQRGGIACRRQSDVVAELHGGQRGRRGRVGRDRLHRSLPARRRVRRNSPPRSASHWVRSWSRSSWPGLGSSPATRRSLQSKPSARWPAAATLPMIGVEGSFHGRLSGSFGEVRLDCHRKHPHRVVLPAGETPRPTAHREGANAS